MIRNACVFIWTFTFIIFTTNLAHADKLNEPNLWKTECIGRYQIGMPGEVEIALSSAMHLFRPEPDTRFRFNDEVIADSSIGYTVYPKMNINESFVFMKNIKNMFDKNIAERYQESHTVMDRKYAHWIFFGDELNKMDFAWVDPDGYSLFIYRDGNYFNFGTSFVKSNNPAKNTEKAISALNMDINTFHPRPLYHLPKQPGVCIPYGFIADDGTAPRNIAVTMRLIDHPDVEIFFQDSSYQLSPGEHSDSKQEILLFLDQYARKQKYVDTGFWGTHSIQMSGQKGRGNFFTIARKDDTIDYGYIASVKGDFTARTDTPAQMLYVIRTASRAKGAPVSKDEIKDIAEKIMASVKRHPVQ